MNLQDLEQYPLAQLEKEIQKRREKENKIKKQIEDDEKLKAYLDRPECALLGRAYGSNNVLHEFVLATFNIVGNAGKRYEFKAKVSSKVNTYFSNTFGWASEHELEDAMKILVKSYLARRLNDPKVIFELIGLSDVYGSIYGDNSIAKKDFDEAVIERMKEFSDEEILACGNNLSHGGRALQLVKTSRGLIKRRKNRVRNALKTKNSK